MPDTPSITINKEFTYRGQAEVYSNTYHFSGTVPSNDAEWHALALAIWGQEKTLVRSNVLFVGYLGYTAGNNHAVSLKNYREDGTAPVPGTNATTGDTAPGDVAMWVRWATPGRTSRGKRIYLRKYFHGMPVAGDPIIAALKTSALAYANKMIDGTLPGGVKICGPQGAVASDPAVGPYITTRTLKRRGRRPS